MTAALGALLLGLAGDRFWLLAGAFSGFLLVAPVLATGLHAVSRALQKGQSAGLATALAVWPSGRLAVWRPNNGRLVLFGILLAFAGTGWVLISASLITRFAEAPAHNPQDFLRVVVLSAHGHLCEGRLLLGSTLAGPSFASTVGAVPLLMDRDTDLDTDRSTDSDIGVRAAVLLSMRAALLNPLPMALWATLILVITLLGMATLLVGMVVAVPWLAHASWHAYRDLVDLEGSR